MYCKNCNCYCRWGIFGQRIIQLSPLKIQHLLLCMCICCSFTVIKHRNCRNNSCVVRRWKYEILQFSLEKYFHFNARKCSFTLPLSPSLTLLLIKFEVEFHICCHRAKVKYWNFIEVILLACICTFITKEIVNSNIQLNYEARSRSEVSWLYLIGIVSEDINTSMYVSKE